MFYFENSLAVLEALPQAPLRNPTRKLLLLLFFVKAKVPGK